MERHEAGWNIPTGKHLSSSISVGECDDQSSNKPTDGLCDKAVKRLLRQEIQSSAEPEDTTAATPNLFKRPLDMLSRWSFHSRENKICVPADGKGLDFPEEGPRVQWYVY